MREPEWARLAPLAQSGYTLNVHSYALCGPTPLEVALIVRVLTWV
jgi:hypothetical protein